MVPVSPEQQLTLLKPAQTLAEIAQTVRDEPLLAVAHPDRFLPELSRSLRALGRCRLAMGRTQEAVCSTKEALSILAPFLTRTPEAFRELATTLAKLYRESSEKAQQEPDVELLQGVSQALGNGHPAHKIE